MESSDITIIRAFLILSLIFEFKNIFIKFYKKLLTKQKYSL